jgi:hypothetical protein
LFDLVVNLIEKDPNRKSLLKTIFFHGVSTLRLIKFFNHFSIEDIDSDLFESINTRLFCDIFEPNSLPSSRWNNSPIFHSKKNIDTLLQLFQDHFHETSNPVESFKSIVRENEKMKKEIETLKKYSKPIQVNFSGCKGVISTLRQNDSSSIELSSSSDLNPYLCKEHILKPDGKYWFSRDEPNSWIQFKFKTNQISPSSYVIRNKASSYSDFHFSPQGWKLEGSIDGIKWEIIHEVRNCESFRKDEQEVIFSCETEDFFSFLRFTQTQENLKNFHDPVFQPQHCFLLNYVDFSGEIISSE